MVDNLAAEFEGAVMKMNNTIERPIEVIDDLLKRQKKDYDKIISKEVSPSWQEENLLRSMGLIPPSKLQVSLLTCGAASSRTPIRDPVKYVPGFRLSTGSFICL
jgi:hypothetical protein